MCSYTSNLSLYICTCVFVYTKSENLLQRGRYQYAERISSMMQKENNLKDFASEVLPFYKAHQSTLVICTPKSLQSFQNLLHRRYKSPSFILSMKFFDSPQPTQPLSSGGELPQQLNHAARD